MYEKTNKIEEFACVDRVQFNKLCKLYTYIFVDLLKLKFT